MKILRFFSLGVLFTLVALLLFSWLVLPSAYTVDVSVPVEASKQDVYEQINTLQNWQNWALPSMENNGNNYTGPVSGEGAVFEWKDAESEGRLEIVETTPYQEVQLRTLTSGGQFESEITFYLHEENGVTLVKWQEEGDYGWNPLTRLTASMLGFQEKISENYQQSLQRLKDYLESKNAT